MKMHTLVAVGTALAVFLVVAIDAPVRAEVVVDGGGGSFVTLFGEEIGLQVGERFQVLNPIEANRLSPEPLLAPPGRIPRPSNR